MQNFEKGQLDKHRYGIEVGLLLYAFVKLVPAISAFFHAINFTTNTAINDYTYDTLMARHEKMAF